MNAIENELRAAFEDERDSVTTPDTLLASLTTRVQRRRVSTLTGATVGTLSVASLALAIPLALSHGPSTSVAPGATATAMSPNSLGLSCGDPVPASLLASPDQSEIEVFETVVAMHPDENSGMVTTPLEPGPNTPEPDLYAVFKVTYPGAIIGRDGIVAGWTEVPPQYAAQIIFESDPPDAPRTVTVFNSGRIQWCPDTRRGANEVPLPKEGTYLVLPFGDATAAP